MAGYQLLAYFLVILFTERKSFVVGEMKSLTSTEPRALTPRIIGGNLADRKRYPYYTFIKTTYSYFGKSYSAFCGGTLIAKDVVLTAAHCATPDDALSTVSGFETWVNATSYDYSPYEFYRVPNNYFVHPDYDPDTVDNDLALLILTQPVTGVPLIQLNRDASVPVAGETLMAVGLGINDVNQQTLPDYLLEVALDTLSFGDCLSKYGDITDEYHVCAGGVEGKDTCQGDSGGPLFHLGTTAAQDVQMGLTSFGKGCGLAGFPTVYTRVSTYLEWIDSIVCQYSNFKPPSCTGVSPTVSPTTKPTKRPTTKKPTTKRPTTRKPTTRRPTIRRPTAKPTRRPTKKPTV